MIGFQAESIFKVQALRIGFNRRGLYRMKQFYELYKDNEKVSTLLTLLNWSNHLKIMSACKTMEERMFYMSMCVKEKYSVRELCS